MQEVVQVQVRRQVFVRTAEILRDFGRSGDEGFVLWLGLAHGQVAQVTGLLVPPQSPIREDRGVGYFVDAETLFELNKWLHQEQLQIIAQVHSHPGEAYHSATDDEYAIATQEGSLSLVVPDFATGPADVSAWAVYRLRRGRWVGLRRREVASLFWIEE